MSAEGVSVVGNAARQDAQGILLTAGIVGRGYAWLQPGSIRCVVRATTGLPRAPR